jgi:hypothetical protein
VRFSRDANDALRDVTAPFRGSRLYGLPSVVASEEFSPRWVWLGAVRRRRPAAPTMAIVVAGAGEGCGRCESAVPPHGRARSAAASAPSACLALEQDTVGPGDQVERHEHQLQPDGVGRKVGEGQVTHAAVLGAADPIVDAGMTAVAGFQKGDVGIGLGGAVLRAGRWPGCRRRPPRSRSRGWLRADACHSPSRGATQAGDNCSKRAEKWRSAGGSSTIR